MAYDLLEDTARVSETSIVSAFCGLIWSFLMNPSQIPICCDLLDLVVIERIIQPPTERIPSSDH